MATQGFFDEHWTDENGNPAGGVSSGKGFTVSWQNGPLGKVGTSERREPNGAFVEDIIEAAASRIRFYESGKFACDENKQVLELLRRAVQILEQRTKRRVIANVEGTHEKH